MHKKKYVGWDWIDVANLQSLVNGLCGPPLYNSEADGNNSVHIIEAAHETQRTKPPGFSFLISSKHHFTNCTKVYMANSSPALQFLWSPSVAFAGAMRHCSRKMSDKGVYHIA